MSGEIVVIGIGNILLKDDGAGVHALNRLKTETLPASVKLVDGGTSVMDMLYYFTDHPRVIIIDALKGGYAPGTIYKIPPEAIKSYKQEHLSLHDVQILDVIKMANQLGHFPNVILYAIEPGEISYSLEMSASLTAKIPELCRLVREEIMQAVPFPPPRI